MIELLYQSLIHLYPPDFLQRNRRELILAFQDLRSEMKDRPIRFCARISWDLLISITKENLSVLGRKGIGRVIVMQSMLMTAIVSLVALMCYAVGQQVLRQGANYPQVQTAQDLSARLSSGEETFLPETSTKVDPSRSLTPFVIVFDQSGRPTSSSAILNGRTPVPPPGVLMEAQRKGENRITWQPRPGVRIAAVVVPYRGNHSGFVLAGRSLAEVEASEANIGHLAFAGWLGLLAILGAGTLVVIHFAKTTEYRASSS